jgi:hypothetical protein
MRKHLLLSTFATLVLLGGAAAAEAPSKPPAPAPGPAPGPAPAAGPTQMLRLTLSIKAGADARAHELSLSDQGCGSVVDKSPAHEDHIRVCSRRTSAGVLLDTDWSTRAGAAEYHTRGELLLPRSGPAGELGRANGPRLGVSVR